VTTALRSCGCGVGNAERAAEVEWRERPGAEEPYEEPSLVAGWRFQALDFGACNSTWNGIVGQ
jgi:hypothetical protein